MNSVGERLRLERLRQGRDISDIAAQTRINPRYIEAIEADDLRSLPGGFFYRSFVRQYAGVLGIDEAEVDQELETLLGPPEDPYSAPPRPSDPIEVPPMPTAGRADATRQIPKSLVLLLVVIIGTGVVYQWWQSSRKGPETVAEPPAAVTQQQQPVPAPVVESPVPAPQTATTQTPASQPAASSTTPPVTVPAPVPAPPAAPPASAGTIGTVQVVANADVWIRLNSGGKNLVERVLKAGESRTVALNADGMMRVGDAGNLQVWWNGKSLGPLGPVGQLRDVSFTANGARVSLIPRTPPATTTTPQDPQRINP